MLKYFFSWIKWLCNNKPMLSYDGFHCGCCGNWTKKDFQVPTYKSVGKDWDTIGLCNKCITEGEEYARRNSGCEK